MGVGVFPILGLGLDQPAPESGMTVGVKARSRQIVAGIAVAAHHIFGDRAHGDQLGIARKARIMGLQQVEHAQTFRGIAVGEIKARQGQTRGAPDFCRSARATAWASLRSVARKLPPLASPQWAKSI
jgi:hypothetical protein